MTIFVNGEPYTPHPCETVATLLVELGLGGAACAVEVLKLAKSPALALPGMHRSAEATLRDLPASPV